MNDSSWYCLGDGETFEDMISTALTTIAVPIRCPERSRPVAVSEESLGRLAMEMLAQF